VNLPRYHRGMSAPYASSPATAVPATKEFTVAWIAYLCYLASSLFLWPAIIGLIISYSRRGRAESGFIDSHHRWMLRSFWYSQLWFPSAFIVFMYGIWPTLMHILSPVLDAAMTGREPVIDDFDFDISWGMIFHTISAASIGVIGFALTWFWFVY